MAHLVKCIECEHEISNDARHCTRCKTIYPHGRMCNICLKFLPDSQGKYLFEYQDKVPKKQAIYEADKRISGFRGGNNPWGHPACLTKLPLVQIPLCPVCKKSNTILSSACEKCGHDRSRELAEEIVKCRYCGFEMNRNIAIDISKKVEADYDLVKERPKVPIFGYWCDSFCHKECYVSRHPSACFIATAAFGSPLAPEVQTLRNFRDDILRNYLLGQQFIEFYERVSPPIANIIAQNNGLRHLTRCLIVYPATWIAKLFLR